MKNLEIHQCYSHTVEFIQEAMLDDKQMLEMHCTIDPNNDDLYVLLNNELYRISSNFKSVDVTKLCILEQEDRKIVGLEYSMTLQELYCAYQNGDVFCIDIFNSDHCEYNLMHQFETGLQCMKLSPDHEIITFVTDEGTLIIMVSDFVGINEVDLYSSNFGSKQFVSVGWGKKETQFHGSAGKAAATAKQKQLEENELDSGCIRIVWHDDGQSFVVSFLHPETKVRIFKIFARDGTLLYTNEETNGLGDCLSWKSSGNLITTVIKTDNTYLLTFYEKNGLKYKDFMLSFTLNPTIVTNLLWSPESDILASICKHCTTGITMLQLWTLRNDHLYLKQNICFPQDNPILYMTWSKEVDNKNKLIVLSLKDVTIYSFNWCINRSRGKTAEDLAVVVVIDGNYLRITAFRKGIIPPPLAHQTLEVQSPVNAIMFAPDVDNETSDINSNVFCVYTCDDSFIIFRRKMDTSKIEYELSKKFHISYDNIDAGTKLNKHSYILSHFSWFTEDAILCSLRTSYFRDDIICLIPLQEINDTGDPVKIRISCCLNIPIQHIVSSPNTNKVYIVAEGYIYKYIENSIKVTDILWYETCHQIDVMKFASKKHTIIALTHSNRLLLNGCEVAKDVSSYFIHTDFLIYTTLQHTFECIPYACILQAERDTCNYQSWIEDKLRQLTKDIRRVERNSSIITMIPQTSKVILQMPRGNTECIEPRTLIMHTLKQLLDNCHYAVAFACMKKQHINFNVIYDHDPELFTQNAEKFVKDIANPLSLSLFLSGLQDEDITKTMYSNYYADRLRAKNTSKSKIKHVCNLLRDIMEKQHDADGMIQPILISLWKGQAEEGLVTALAKVKKLMILEDSEKPCFSDISAEKALKYLLNAMDISVLYDAALSMYDLELTMFIANRSQKDPKEYIPFLNSLKVMDENYMKYSIDMHLRRYELALVHIAKDARRFDKCLNLICTQKLYKQALKLFKRNTTEYKRIATTFGEYLMQQQTYHEAGMIFSRSNNLDKALEAFLLAGSWEDAIILLRRMQLRSEDLRMYYQTAVKRLKTNGKYNDAATVLLHYLNDAEEAIAVLCEGRSWKHAIRIAYDVQRSDLIDTHVKPGIKEHADFLMSHLGKTKEDFLKYKSRLALLRLRIGIRQDLVVSEMFSHTGLLSSADNDVTDMLSDTTSVADSISTKNSQTSTKSGRSYRSCKNRRKQERKLLSLKEGSMFEDFGLINALYHLIANTHKNIDEWTQLVETLVHFELDETAEKLQDEINSFFRLVQDSKSEIWDKHAPTSIDELRGKGNYTLSQFNEITAPLKSLERFVIFPPDTGVSYLNIV